METQGDNQLVSSAPTTESNAGDLQSSQSGTSPQPQLKLFDSSLFDQPRQDGGAVDDFMTDIAGSKDQGTVSGAESFSDVEVKEGHTLTTDMNLPLESIERKVAGLEHVEVTHHDLSGLDEVIPGQDEDILCQDEDILCQDEVIPGQDEVILIQDDGNAQNTTGDSLIQIETNSEDSKLLAGGSVMPESEMKVAEDNPPEDDKLLAGVSVMPESEMKVAEDKLPEDKLHEDDTHLAGGSVMPESEMGVAEGNPPEDSKLLVWGSVMPESEMKVAEDNPSEDDNLLAGGSVMSESEMKVAEDKSPEDDKLLVGGSVMPESGIKVAEHKPPKPEAPGQPAQTAELKQEEKPVQSNAAGPKPTENVPHGILKQSSAGSFPTKRISWGDDDPFLSAITNSETDRRQDAWLPPESTAKVLQARVAMQGTDYASRPDLTMPGISFDEAQMDPLKELLYKYHGEEEAKKRNKLTLDQVSRDLDGLKRLLNDGCLRSAVQLTGLLLTSVGQGKGQAEMPSQNTAESLQIWFTRLALLVKLRQFSTADIESQPFKDLDKPDMYYQYYPALYPGRKGSMVPFSFRVLLAELPQYVSQHQESMTRLYALLVTSQKIISNLSSGCDEYGDMTGVSEEYIKASLTLWKGRVHRIQHSIGNCLLAMKDYYQSIKVFERLSKSDSQNQNKLQSLIGRIYLQLGDLKSAQEVYSLVEKETNAEDKTGTIQVLMNRGFLRMAQNMYTDAHIQFSEVVKLDPSHFTAINNISVCLLYMGKLKSALTLLESLIDKEPDKYLDESILFNLCTLYELESSRSATKKQNLLAKAARHRGDGFNVGCLKLT